MQALKDERNCAKYPFFLTQLPKQHLRLQLTRVIRRKLIIIGFNFFHIWKRTIRNFKLISAEQQ